MNTDAIAPLGVCVLPEPARNAARSAQYAGYIDEILAHAGLCYVCISLEELPDRLPSLRVLLTIGESPLAAAKQSLEAWVQSGGAWMSVAGVCGMQDTLGVALEAPAYASWGGGVCSLGDGYLHPSRAHPVLDGVTIPLHFYGGVAVTADGATTIATASDAHQRTTSHAALTEHPYGQGLTMLLAVDLTGTIVRIQQGIAVTRDGVSAPDGTAPVADGVLKSDDGAVLDWVFDRQEVTGVRGYRAFLEPVADHWRDLLLRALFYLMRKLRVALPVLWLYPHDMPAIAHLSHDTDGNTVAEADRLLEVLREIEAVSTWCVILPGYPPETIAAIRDAGHELAMHYDAMSEGLPWGQDQFTRQWAELTMLFTGQRPVSNKNHYLRWEGDTEFYGWCETQRIQLDQTKGASKTGEAGFNFGTCHPYFAAAPDGTRHDVLELCTPTQDLEVFAPSALLEPLLAAVVRHHGVLHLLFHPAHIFKPGVAESMRLAAARVEESGMEFWTAERLNGWERARRGLVWTNCSSLDGTTMMTLRASAPIANATILVLSDTPAIATLDGNALPVRGVQRWGQPFQAVTFDMDRDTAYTLRFETASRQETTRENTH